MFTSTQIQCKKITQITSTQTTDYNNQTKRSQALHKNCTYALGNGHAHARCVEGPLRSHTHAQCAEGPLRCRFGAASRGAKKMAKSPLRQTTIRAGPDRSTFAHLKHSPCYDVSPTLYAPTESFLLIFFQVDHLTKMGTLNASEVVCCDDAHSPTRLHTLWPHARLVRWTKRLIRNKHSIDDALQTYIVTRHIRFIHFEMTLSINPKQSTVVFWKKKLHFPSFISQWPMYSQIIF